jgi:hypothetical protein
VADRSYDLRVVATDLAGNTRTSSTVASRRVDNTGPTVALTDPGSPLTGTVKLSASASDPSGVASVAIQRRPSGGSTWTTICTDVTSNYSCSWATTGAGDATYDLQAVATDTLGRSSTPPLVAARRTENFAPTATDIQAVNGGGTAGRIDAGDVITFSYSEAIAPASLLSGWAGTSRTVSVRVTDAGTLDTLSVYDANNTTRIQLTPNATELALKADRTAGGASFSATMALSGGQVTVTLGSPLSGSTKSTTSMTRMVWTPSTSATDLAGKAVSAAAVTESGTDMDF